MEEKKLKRKGKFKKQIKTLALFKICLKGLLVDMCVCVRARA